MLDCALPGAKVPAVDLPECTQDADCPSQRSCLQQRCQNPCAVSAVCSPAQECRVLDTLPLRTVVCVCPPDTIASKDGRCSPIGECPPPPANNKTSGS